MEIVLRQILEIKAENGSKEEEEEGENESQLYDTQYVANIFL